MNKKWLIQAAALCGVSLLLVLLLYNSLIGDIYFNQIQEGMTESQIEAILGMPPGDYRSARHINPPHYVHRLTPIAHMARERGLSQKKLSELESQRRQTKAAGASVTPRKWLTNSWGMYVVFDEKGFVIRHELLEVNPPPPPPGFLEKIRWYTGI